MLGLDDNLAELGAGHGLLVALALAFLLGLRHATDPDHLAAVSALVVSDAAAGTRRALRLGLAWGAGHAITLTALGLPVLAAGRELPDGVHRAAEPAVGLLVVALGARLLVRWHRGPGARPDRLGRSPRAALGIGLVHGVGGSAGATVLLLGTLPGAAEATAGLALFAAATAVSMALLSAGLGRALAAGPRGAPAWLTPGFGTAALLFGAWYAAGSAGLVPYAF